MGPSLFLTSVTLITANVLGSWEALSDDLKHSISYPRNNVKDREEGVRKL